MKPAAETRYAIGVDLVEIRRIEALIGQSGSTFRNVFGDREWRYAQSRPDPMASLAGRWAAKEATVKAWSQFFYGEPGPLREDELVWSEIETCNDRFGRPGLNFRGRVAELIAQDERVRHASWQLSISHEASYAIASVLLISRSDWNRGSGT